MEAVKTNYPNLASESFGHGRQHYYIDVKRAVNDTHFVLITSSERFAGDERFYRKPFGYGKKIWRCLLRR